MQKEALGVSARRRESIFHILHALNALVPLHTQERRCHLLHTDSGLVDKKYFAKYKLHHVKSQCYRLWKQILGHTLKDKSSYNIVICLAIWNIENLMKGGTLGHEIWTTAFTNNATSKRDN